ncbi:MAG: non-canonical purine NTP pyrophosphatase, partial [Christensenellales bacterium]
MAREKSGTYGWSWDFIFIPDGYDKTMGNYSNEERCLVWNTDAYHELAKFLK